MESPLSPASSTPSTARLVQLASLVLVFHVSNSVLQEAVFHIPGFHFSIFLSFLQMLCVTGFALFDFRRQGQKRRTDLKVYLCLSVFAVMSSVLTNEAAHRINYPTQVIFKSSKLLFVMALRALVLPGRARISRGELASSLAIVGGLIVFTYATSAAKMSGGSTVSAHDMFIGIAAVVVALCCDALLYIGEEKFCFIANKSSNTEVILYCNGMGVCYSLLTLGASGQMGESVSFALKHPSMLALVGAFSLCNFGGTTFLLQSIVEFGSNTAVVITSTRKMFTVLFSFLFYPKPFTLPHMGGLLLVVYGIWLHEDARKKKSKEPEDAAV
jgi:adenosine 3'-phospho 5'-phosphosulfate transporter B3